jgi:hypothetical protein
VAELSFAEKVRSLGYLSRGRTRPRVTEGREHPETGVPWKTVTTEAGSTTEHNTRDDRVDAVARVETVHAVLNRGKASNA